MSQSTTARQTRLHDALRWSAHRLTGAAADLDRLLALIGDAHFVLIGEATHGTHEFYRLRAEITKRLISEKGFTGVAVEADWPDAYRVNCFVRHASHLTRADEALSGFERFPTWMWRNTDVVEFVEWLRQHNEHRSVEQRAGFYGLDLYSLFTSIDAVIEYLDRTDPAAAKRARQRYACLEHFGRDEQAYGYGSAFRETEECEEGVVTQLLELQQQRLDAVSRDGRVAEDEHFFAEQNARLVVNAEEYYRTMFYGRSSSWNLRDRHMSDTLEALTTHLGRHGAEPRIVLWAHNSHLGDARATEMGTSGEWNVGQLVREGHGMDAVLIGFTTYHGTVTAASEWGGPAERKRVRRAFPGSYEALFHETGLRDFYLNLRAGGEAVDGLRQQRLERAIGVIYRPETERISHYFLAQLPQQFDAVIHLDETQALEPLERTAAWETGEPPETYPFGV